MTQAFYSAMSGINAGQTQLSVVSNNIANDGNIWHCMARTKRAIAFAEQLKSVEAFRPEKRFADAVKGLHLYGGTVVYPEELVVLNLSVA